MDSVVAVTSSADSDRQSLLLATERLKASEEKNLTRVDLSRLKLSECPQGLLDLTNLKKLIISRNALRAIPDELFNQLHQLKWLDLRSNILGQIPSTIKALKDLQVLLIDDNLIRILPFELGLLHKLKQLHFRNNPIEFPSKAILEKGTKTIMRFLHDCYTSREQAADSKGSSLPEAKQNGTNLETHSANNAEEKLSRSCSETELFKASGHHEDLQASQSSRKWASSKNAAASDVTFNSELTSPGQCDGSSTLSIKPLYSGGKSDSVSRGDNETEGKLNQPLSMGRHTESAWLRNLQENRDEKPFSSKPRIYKEVERAYLNKRGNVTKPQSAFEKYFTQTARHEALLPIDPPQPTLEKIRFLHAKERRRKLHQNASIKQHNVIQKLKDAEKIRQWRENYRQRQRETLLEYLNKTQNEIKDEADQRITSAPFDVEQDDLKMLDTAELNAIRQRRIRSASKPKNLDPYIVLQLELASLDRDQRLTQQVNRHVRDMMDRFQIPLPQNREALSAEMLTAKRDLDQAIRLHQKVKQRLETLEHFRGSNRRDLWQI
ncbi:hypothetical protein PHET_07377 [Paragonimus heterotremus]|uniref:Leucine-rich repeat-containing protein 27 n=1 Tax=Paragonimus heterotremus TaxID=100268 RepID=A0A8J4TI16_9TREM|nr:hypothetical protein PHET_07377 [Paragonimus heterotremus]